MADRKAELERKKAKLLALREQKERRRREKEQKDVEEAAIRAATGGEKDQRKELDHMLSSLGVAPVSDVLSSLSSMSSLTPEQSANHTPDSSLQISTKKKTDQLSVVFVQATDIPAKEVVVYDRQTQTAHSGHERNAHASDYYVITFDDLQAEEDDNSLPHLDGSEFFKSKLPPGILPHGLPLVKEVKPAVTAVEQEANKHAVPEVRELSEEEKQMIILTEDFQRFIGKAGRIMERALGESVDIYTDYSGGGDGEGGDEKSGMSLSLNRWFMDDRWSRNRCVTSMDWSTHYPELLLASYHNNIDSPNDPDGVCLVWNTKFKTTTPEYIFHCQSPVLSSTFARFHPNLILGGTYSGQIVLWDNRVLKRTPIQRTPLSAVAHTHPVYCLSIVGTQNAHNLISVSTDGRLCSWSLDMLSQPQDTLELSYKQGKPVNVTCLTFPNNEVNNFILGSEEGTVFSACRHGNKTGCLEAFEGHHAFVPSISSHAAQQGGADFSHLFLTSSFDWTVKLWSVKENRPLYSFEDNDDYVYDVAWSPLHPALFAAVDGTGRLDVWDLNRDTEVPKAKVVVDGSPALNKVSWTQSGYHVTVGDDCGKIWVYDVGEQLAQPKHDEWNKFKNTLQDLKYDQDDENYDDIPVGSSLSSLASLSSSPLR